jgi:hypothetical protein
MKWSVHHRALFAGAVLVVLVFAAFLARVGQRLWRERQQDRAATELADRYLTLMHSGGCAAAQRLTVFPGPASYCAAAGDDLGTSLVVNCEHAERRHEQHHVYCDVRSTSHHDAVEVLVVTRDGGLRVVDAASRTETFLP